MTVSAHLFLISILLIKLILPVWAETTDTIGDLIESIQEEEAAAAADVFDCPNCQNFPREVDGNDYCNQIDKNTLGQANWRIMPGWDVSMEQKTIKVIDLVNQINTLHGTEVDPRFVACIARKETRMNPLAGRCGGSDIGMFQTVNITAKDIWQRGPIRSELPTFKDLSWEDYKQQMGRSALAQVEMAVMTLFVKAIRKNKSFIEKRGKVGRSVYESLARSYYGDYSGDDPPEYIERADNYQAAIKGCYGCLIDNDVIGSKGQMLNTSNLEYCMDKVGH